MMTNVRASNLHPTFLLRRYPAAFWTLPFQRERREKVVLLRSPVNVASSPRRRPVVDLPLRPIRPSPEALNLQVPSARRNPRVVGCLRGKARRAAIKPTFWQIASVFLSCGNIPAADIWLGIHDWDDFRGIRKRARYRFLFKFAISLRCAKPGAARNAFDPHDCSRIISASNFRQSRR